MPRPWGALFVRERLHRRGRGRAGYEGDQDPKRQARGFYHERQVLGGHGQIFRNQRGPPGARAKRNLQNRPQKSSDQTKPLCTVFAESEIVSLSANGAETSEIAYAIVDSSAHKVASLIKRLENQIYFLSGGLSNVPLFKQLLGEHLGAEIFTHENAIYCGAMGASLIGARKANEISKETR